MTFVAPSTIITAKPNDRWIPWAKKRVFKYLTLTSTADFTSREIGTRTSNFTTDEVHYK